MAEKKTGQAEKTPDERTAEAVRLREEGDPRPVSQIEAEALAAEDAARDDKLVIRDPRRVGEPAPDDAGAGQDSERKSHYVP